MAQKDPLQEIVSELDFNKALSRVKADSYYDFIQVPVEIDVFESDLEENIKFLVETIESGNHSISPLRKIWVPKKQYFLRPGSIPYFEDRLIFQAIIDHIAPLLESQLPPLEQKVVFSSRLHPDLNNENMFIHPRDLWLDFKETAITYCNHPDTKHVLVSDIASYFENIDLRLLGDNLSSFGVSPKYVEAILYFLRKWANGRTRGLPQMMAPCSLLANAYLAQIDKRMLLHGYKYLRYVDDIRIFVSSEIELKKALLILTDELKQIYLDVQASKTKFITSKEHLDELTVLEKDLERVGIETEIEAGDSYSRHDSNYAIEEISEDKLIQFLDDLVKDPQYDDRHLRYCVNRLAKIGSPAARITVLENLSLMPQETATFVKYLLSIEDTTKNDTVTRIIDFLESESNIYDWQTMWLLIYLSKIKFDDSQLPRLFRINKLKEHWINRAFLNYILCSQGDLIIRRGVIKEYGQEQNTETKIAILCGLYNLDKKERNRFYSIAGGTRQLDQLIKLLKYKQIDFSINI